MDSLTRNRWAVLEQLVQNPQEYAAPTVPNPLVPDGDYGALVDMALAARWQPTACPIAPGCCSQAPFYVHNLLCRIPQLESAVAAVQLMLALGWKGPVVGPVGTAAALVRWQSLDRVLALVTRLLAGGANWSWGLAGAENSARLGQVEDPNHSNRLDLLACLLVRLVYCGVDGRTHPPLVAVQQQLQATDHPLANLPLVLPPPPEGLTVRAMLEPARDWVGLGYVGQLVEQYLGRQDLGLPHSAIQALAPQNPENQSPKHQDSAEQGLENIAQAPISRAVHRWLDCLNQTIAAVPPPQQRRLRQVHTGLSDYLRLSPNPAYFRAYLHTAPPWQMPLPARRELAAQVAQSQPLSTLEDYWQGCLTDDAAAQETDPGITVESDANSPPGLDCDKEPCTNTAPILNPALSPAELDFWAMVLQGKVLRGEQFAPKSPAAPFQAALAQQQHPLASLPLVRHPLEAHCQLFTYHLTENGLGGSGYGTPPLDPAAAIAPHRGFPLWSNATPTPALGATLQALLSTWQTYSQVDIFRFSSPLPAAALSPTLLQGLGLACLAGAGLSQIRLHRVTAAWVWQTLFHIAASGLISAQRHSEAYGRLEAWKGLAALVEAVRPRNPAWATSDPGMLEPTVIDYAALSTQVQAITWYSLAASSPWYTGILDHGLVALSPCRRRLACLAITDTD